MNEIEAMSWQFNQLLGPQTVAAGPSLHSMASSGDAKPAAHKTPAISPSGLNRLPQSEEQPRGGSAEPSIEADSHPKAPQLEEGILDQLIHQQQDDANRRAQNELTCRSVSTGGVELKPEVSSTSDTPPALLGSSSPSVNFMVDRLLPEQPVLPWSTYSPRIYSSFGSGDGKPTDYAQLDGDSSAMLANDAAVLTSVNRPPQGLNSAASFGGQSSSSTSKILSIGNSNLIHFDRFNESPCDNSASHMLLPSIGLMGVDQVRKSNFVGSSSSLSSSSSSYPPASVLASQQQHQHQHQGMQQSPASQRLAMFGLHKSLGATNNSDSATNILRGSPGSSLGKVNNHRQASLSSSASVSSFGQLALGQLANHNLHQHQQYHQGDEFTSQQRLSHPFGGTFQTRASFGAPDRLAGGGQQQMTAGAGGGNGAQIVGKRRNKLPLFGKASFVGAAGSNHLGPAIDGSCLTGNDNGTSLELDMHGSQVINSDGSNRFSRKVFVGGLPPDIDEEEIKASFRRFGSLVVDWPHKAESKSYFPPKGYAFLLFQEESSVQALIDACIQEDDKLYLCVSSPTIKDKPVQIRPWRLIDADHVLDSTLALDPRKTVFVGGVPRPLKASELAVIMNNLYGGVCYAGIDTDPELKYPKGAGRVAFSNHHSYIAAISARFVHLQHSEIEKRVEVKPYVLDDQFCDECRGAKCGLQFAPFFCANINCLRYYCENCWSSVHSHSGREFHKPLVKEGADRPSRGIPPSRWS